MSKSRNAFRTISEVARLLDTPTHVLRFWESKFAQLRPVKRAGGRRYYRPNDVALLAGIRQLLHDDGMTIKGVQKLLREQGVQAVMAPLPSPAGPRIVSPAPAAVPVWIDRIIPETHPGQPEETPAAQVARTAPATPPPERFSLDRPAHQPSLFAEEPALRARPRALAYAVGIRPQALLRKRARIAPLVARLEQLHGVLRSEP